MARPRKNRVAYVTFANSTSMKWYAYKCPFPAAKIGDSAIVVTPSGPARVQIQRFAELPDLSAATKSIVAIEDVEAELQEKRRAVRKAEIQARLNEIQREVKRNEMLTALARKSPEARRLLKELESL